MELAKYIDHTCLKADAIVEDIIRLCKEAEEYGFAAVCVNPCYVDLAAHLLADSKVNVCTVIGFPLGANLPEVKVLETKEAVLRKAREVDLVMNIGAAKSGRWEVVVDEIKQVVDAADGAVVKVIIETALLTTGEKRQACQAVLDGGAQFVKTSTGFASSGAAEEDIRLMKEIVGDKIKIKAAGGIRTREQAEKMIAAGADRIGTSAGPLLVVK